MSTCDLPTTKPQVKYDLMYRKETSIDLNRSFMNIADNDSYPIHYFSVQDSENISSTREHNYIHFVIDNYGNSYYSSIHGPCGILLSSYLEDEKLVKGKLGIKKFNKALSKSIVDVIKLIKFDYYEFGQLKFRQYVTKYIYSIVETFTTLTMNPINKNYEDIIASKDIRLKESYQLNELYQSNINSLKKTINEPYDVVVECVCNGKYTAINIRKEPTIDSPCVGKINNNEQLNVKYFNDEWYILPNNNGYVRKYWETQEGTIYMKVVDKKRFIHNGILKNCPQGGSVREDYDRMCSATALSSGHAGFSVYGNRPPRDTIEYSSELVYTNRGPEIRVTRNEY